MGSRRKLGQVDEIVRRSQGTVEIVPVAGRWWVAGVVADHFPLDRESPLPRPLRRVGHWIRLVFLDRPLTNADRSAILTLGAPSVVGTVAVCVVAAVVAPWVPTLAATGCSRGTGGLGPARPERAEGARHPPVAAGPGASRARRQRLRRPRTGARRAAGWSRRSPQWVASRRTRCCCPGVPTIAATPA